MSFHCLFPESLETSRDINLGTFPSTFSVFVMHARLRPLNQPAQPTLSLYTGSLPSLLHPWSLTRLKPLLHPGVFRVTVSKWMLYVIPERKSSQRPRISVTVSENIWVLIFLPTAAVRYSA